MSCAIAAVQHPYSRKPLRRAAGGRAEEGRRFAQVAYPANGGGRAASFLRFAPVLQLPQSSKGLECELQLIPSRS